MIKAIRKRARPDNLRNQVRAGGQSFARRLYVWTVVGLLSLLAWTFTGHWFFLDAEGLVTKERTVVAPDYAARVVALHVRPGDRVEAGQHLATLYSREITDQLAEFATRRGTVASRRAQVTGRIEVIRRVLPSAGERRRRAIESQRQLAALNKRGLTTSPRVQETERELYDAEREESSLASELKALEDELTNIDAALAQMDGTILATKHSYNGGRVVAPGDGLIGARVASVGQIVRSGESLFDLHHGEMFVLAYMPIGRLYSIAPGDAVRVTDGQTTFPGRVDRIRAVTDALPPEFQVNFRAQDRQQIFSIRFDQPPPFAIQAKVRLSGNWSPQGVVRFGMGAATAAGGWIADQWRLRVATRFAQAGPPAP